MMVGSIATAMVKRTMAARKNSTLLAITPMCACEASRRHNHKREFKHAGDTVVHRIGNIRLKTVRGSNSARIRILRSLCNSTY